MATASESGRGERRSGRRSGGAAVTTETILDIVERLGLIDLITARLRARLEEVDIDELFDELGDYVKRNPEVLVVALATITVSAGLIVYLNNRRDSSFDRNHSDEEEQERPARVAASRATAPKPRRAT